METLFPRSESCIGYIYVCRSIYVPNWEKCLVTPACPQWHMFSQGWIKIIFSCTPITILCVQGEGFPLFWFRQMLTSEMGIPAPKEGVHMATAFLRAKMAVVAIV